MYGTCPHPEVTIPNPPDGWDRWTFPRPYKFGYGLVVQAPVGTRLREARQYVRSTIGQTSNVVYERKLSVKPGQTNFVFRVERSDQCPE
jgi:hypothetical protein